MIFTVPDHHRPDRHLADLRGAPRFRESLQHPDPSSGLSMAGPRRNGRVSYPRTRVQPNPTESRLGMFLFRLRAFDIAFGASANRLGTFPNGFPALPNGFQCSQTLCERQETVWQRSKTRGERSKTLCERSTPVFERSQSEGGQCRVPHSSDVCSSGMPGIPVRSGSLSNIQAMSTTVPRSLLPRPQDVAWGSLQWPTKGSGPVHRPFRTSSGPEGSSDKVSGRVPQIHRNPSLTTACHHHP